MTGTPISVKEKTFETEARFLSPYAKKSCETKGRARAEAPCEFRTDFQRDRDRIIYSNSFKRLKNKTQVFFAPEGDHYITRLTHTLDVAQISRSIARALSLNEDLAEAIALGHDLGHTPFGHVGERVLDKLSPTGFEHNIQSLRVVDVIEKEGRGLNLTEEVRDGILQHKSTGHPATLEGAAVSLAEDRLYQSRHRGRDPGGDSQRFGSAAKRRGSAGTRHAGAHQYGDYGHLHAVFGTALCAHVGKSGGGDERASRLHV